MSATQLTGRQIRALAGDISGQGDAVSVDKLKGTPISSTAPTTGQVLTFDGSQWTPMAGGGGGGVSGSGTPGKLPKWTGGTTLGDSIVSENSGSVGFNRSPGTAVDGPYVAEFGDQIAIIGDGVSTSSGVRLITYGAENGAVPALSFYSANGTEIAPTGTIAGDIIGFIGGKGFDGTNFSQTGSRTAILMLASEDFTPTAQGTEIWVRVTAPGTTANTNAIIVKAPTNHQGRVGIGHNVDPQATLHVNGQAMIVDGTQGAGKVFTSDANGLGSWQTPSGSADFNRIVTSGGNVVVGNDGNVVFI